jgi:uncharacterized protein
LIPVEGKFLLFNALHSSLLEIDQLKASIIASWGDEMEFVENIIRLEQNDLKVLTENFFLVEKDFDELSIIRQRHQDFKRRISEGGEFELLINPTNGCNMSCAYCFESEDKTANVLRQDVIDNILKKVEEEVKNPRSPIKSIQITWFGGEPLLNPKSIKSLSSKFIDIAQKYHLSYKGAIITNGTLFTPQIWQLFKDCQIKRAQVSIDGSHAEHNARRPLKNNKDSYSTILDNLQAAPADFNITLRIHADRQVVQSLPSLLDELQERGIWPQRARYIYLHLAQKKYNAFSIEEKGIYLNQQEYAYAKYTFRKLCQEKYNQWAKTNSLPAAGLRSLYPFPQYPICKFAVLPYALAIDDLGFIHKCWECVNDPQTRIQHIRDYDFMYSEYQQWRNFDKFSYKKCRECKYLPICDSTCVMDHRKNRELYCSEWKYMLPVHVKNYYAKIAFK